jgi:formylmethanofuran:tetrahydromethanopterin formyltransferase
VRETRNSPSSSRYTLTDAIEMEKELWNRPYVGVPNFQAEIVIERKLVTIIGVHSRLTPIEWY